MFITSVVSMISCFSLVFTEVIPIRSFGFYAAILIAVNFIIVITMLPAMLVFYENRLQPVIS